MKKFFIATCIVASLLFTSCNVFASNERPALKLTLDVINKLPPSYLVQLENIKGPFISDLAPNRKYREYKGKIYSIFNFLKSSKAPGEEEWKKKIVIQVCTIYFYPLTYHTKANINFRIFHLKNYDKGKECAVEIYAKEHQAKWGFHQVRTLDISKTGGACRYLSIEKKDQLHAILTFTGKPILSNIDKGDNVQ